MRHFAGLAVDIRAYAFASAQHIKGGAARSASSASRYQSAYAVYLVEVSCVHLLAAGAAASPHTDATGADGGEARREWTVFRRYSEFRQLHGNIRREFPREARQLPALPPRSFIGTFRRDFLCKVTLRSQMLPPAPLPCCPVARRVAPRWPQPRPSPID